MMEITPTITVLEVVFFVVGVAGLVVSIAALSDAASDRYTQSLSQPRSEMEREVHQARTELAEAHYRSSIAFLLVVAMLTMIAALSMLRRNIDPESLITYAINFLRIGAQTTIIVTIHQLHRARQRVLHREQQAARRAQRDRND
jgi:anaerobic C4-dicarboxylate transporter